MKKLYLYTNNHFSAKSVANAAMIKQQLGEPIEGEYPEEFLEPSIRRVVDVDYSLTYIRGDLTSPFWIRSGTSAPAMTLAEDGVLAVRGPDGSPSVT